jgi:hypothetical protein
MQMTRTEWMTSVQHQIASRFVLCFVLAVIFGAWLFLVTRRRTLWLRYTAAEAAFWHRLGFPSRRITDASRRVEESQVFTYALWFLVIAFLALMLLNAAMYFHFKHRFQSTPAPNQSMKPTAPWQENLSVFATTPYRGLSRFR